MRLRRHCPEPCCGRDGMALVPVLVFTAALLAFGAALLTYAVNEKLIADYYGQDTAKYYLAEAGIEAGLAVLQDDFYCDCEISASLGQGCFTVSFTDLAENRRLVNSAGRLDDYVLELQAVVEYCPAGGAVIVEWRRP